MILNVIQPILWEIRLLWNSNTKTQKNPRTKVNSLEVTNQKQHELKNLYLVRMKFLVGFGLLRKSAPKSGLIRILGQKFGRIAVFGFGLLSLLFRFQVLDQKFWELRMSREQKKWFSGEKIKKCRWVVLHLDLTIITSLASLLLHRYHRFNPSLRHSLTGRLANLDISPLFVDRFVSSLQFCHL